MTVSARSQWRDRRDASVRSRITCLQMTGSGASAHQSREPIIFSGRASKSKARQFADELGVLFVSVRLATARGAVVPIIGDAVGLQNEIRYLNATAVMDI